MNVLLIPEDFRNDQHVLKPLFVELFRTIGRPRARIDVLRDPLLGGIGEATKSRRLAEIVETYRGMTDVFILCVDRDGVEGRRRRLDQIESEFDNDPRFLAENAWEEIETWALAGLDLPREWRWADVRAEVHVKERYFEVLVNRRGLAGTGGDGRKQLGREAARRIDAIRRKCPEDFDALAKRLEAVVRN